MGRLYAPKHREINVLETTSHEAKQRTEAAKSRRRRLRSYTAGGSFGHSLKQLADAEKQVSHDSVGVHVLAKAETIPFIPQVKADVIAARGTVPFRTTIRKPLARYRSIPYHLLQCKTARMLSQL